MKYKTAIQGDQTCNHFAALIKNVPMRCPDSVIREPILRKIHVNCLVSDKIQNNLTMTICICFEHMKFICMRQIILKHPSPELLMVSWKLRL